ncbi:Anthocyanin 5-aromatic acyltransferase [Apostasia shenzhenica]|uniref:Anthocyanin 5-aromatic acyltransferase n=1 Tax=Apostasia shenzhenica TaxID=1088818 RepID=A0A2I0BF80_9ASPA|nr:Anthocyanin 5-aromatic acyltransferase [Apostasia shenzhenica]
MAIRIIEQIQVSPSLPSQPPIPLTFLDTVWFAVPPVERLFFYDFPHPTSVFIDRHLPSLTASLSVTLRTFYPLAGIIHRSPGSADQFEIAYTEGDSVSLTVAEYAGGDIRDFSGYRSRELVKLRLMVPKSAAPPNSPEVVAWWPAMSVQVTLFPNQGLCIGLAVHHSVCDGTSLMRFRLSWAAACRSVKGGPSGEASAADPPPLLDRSIIVDTRGARLKLLEQARRFVAERNKEQGRTEQPPPDQSSSNLVCSTFVLSAAMIEKLKKRVLEAVAEEEGIPKFHCSAFVVSCGYSWSCLVKSRNIDGEATVHFGFSVDWRPRTTPAIPSNYFGNCLGGGFTEMKASKVMESKGFVAAAAAIGKSIDSLQGMDVAENVLMIMDRYVELARNLPLSVAGSPRFRVYDTDFGWGRPAKVEVTSVAETDAMSLAESREEAGGIEIGMVLSRVHMEAFRAFFESGLIDL